MADSNTRLNTGSSEAYDNGPGGPQACPEARSGGETPERPKIVH